MTSETHIYVSKDQAGGCHAVETTTDQVKVS